MPTYEWKCDNCGKVQEVIRNHQDYKVEPDEPCCDNPKRHKYFSKAPEGAKGPNWGAGKGNWLIILGLSALSYLFTADAVAEPVAHIDDVSFEAYHVGTFRDNDFPDSNEKNTKGLAFNLDLGVTEYINWKNKVWTNGNDSQLHTVGWEYDIALQLNKHLEAFHYHHSQHSMDEYTNTTRFPLRNYYGLRVHFTPEAK